MKSRPLNFLLVEDDEDHAEIILHALEEHRSVHVLEHVVDGAEALAYLRREGRYRGRARPDVILLDLKLPKVDGLDVLAALKQDPELRSIPVVVLTTSDAETDRVRAYNNYANSYLVKPIDYERFTRLVEEISSYWAELNRGPGH